MFRGMPVGFSSQVLFATPKITQGSKMKLLLVILILPLLCKTQDDYRGYRLPEVYTPSHYDLHLTVPKAVFNGTSREFTGEVTVTFTVSSEVQDIQINAQILSNETTTIVSNDTTETIAVTSHEYNSTNQIWKLSLNAALKTTNEYKLTIAYTSEMSNTTMKGFYLSSYVNPEGERKYLGTTQFESTSAREAFPCFDEPRYKATYNIKITHPSEQNALANTPIINTTVGEDNYTTTEFQRVPIISTYLIAFLVSDFTCSGTLNITNNIPHKICSSPHSESDRRLASDYSPPIMAVLENITGINYSEHGFGKMDQIAVPDFSAGAMENWGLVTYREAYILYDSDETPETYRKSLLTIVAHEFTHQWFGNLVTMEWWDHIFLNEGFARLYQYFSVELIQGIAWELNKQFIVDQMHSVFIVDGANTSQAITSLAASPAEISSKFGNINYNKAACIIRMVWNIMGTDNYHTAIRNYLTDKAQSTAVASDLVAAWDSQFPEGLYPTGVSNLSVVMDSWLNKAGYPVVTVTLSGNNVTLSQERFLYTNDTDDTKWYVPITYTVSNDTTKFDNYTPVTWLTPDANLTIPNVLPNDPTSWILFNNQQNSYYRLDYDAALWQRIKNALIANHTSIDVMNRAQIVDDLFSYARAGKRNYTEVLDLLTYLRNETEYYPWVAANTGLNYLISRLSHEDVLYERLRTHNLELLRAANASVSFDTPADEGDQVYIFKRTLVLSALCRLGDRYCIDKSLELYRDFRINNVSLDKNLKTVVYCNALKYSVLQIPTADYQFLWNRYVNTEVASEKVVILQSLGCARHAMLLKNFWDEVFSVGSRVRIQDMSTAISSVYNSPVGLSFALEYVIANTAKVSQFTSVSSILSGVASRLTTETQIADFESKIESLPEEYLTDARRHLETAKTNREWASGIEEQLREVFADNEPTTTTTIGDATIPGNGGTTTTPVGGVTDPDTGGSTTPSAAMPNAAFSSLALLILLAAQTFFR